MNYRQMEIFTAIVDYGSVSAAAAALELSQPAVSKSLKMLEQDLGVQLFNRSAAGVQLTLEGTELYRETMRLMRDYAFLEGFARELPKRREMPLRIGCMPAMSHEWLPVQVAAFSRDWPSAKFSLQSHGSADIGRLLLEGEIDAGISHVPVSAPGVEKIQLLSLIVTCVVPLRHRLATREVLDFPDLAVEPIIGIRQSDEAQRNLTRAMERRGYRLDPQFEVYFGNVACRLAEETGCIALCDHQSARRHNPALSRLIPLREEIATPLYLLHNTARRGSPLLAPFIEHLRRN